MKKLHKLLPFALIFHVILWHSCHRLNGSFSLLYNLVVYKGSFALIKELFTFPLKSITTGISFYFFIKYIAPKFSIIFTSILILISYYIFFSASFFYNNLGIFFLASALRIDEKKQTEHLFFSLFYITLLHSFSCLLLSIQFYGYNNTLFLISIAPILCLYFLITKTTYPQKLTLVCLFSLTLFPVSYFVHNPIALSFPLFNGVLLLAISINILLGQKTYAKLVPVFLCCCLQLVFTEKALFFPFIFTPISLLIGIMQTFYASKHRLSSHTHVLPHPMRPFSPSLRFYNEHMHY